MGRKGFNSLMLLTLAAGLAISLSALIASAPATAEETKAPEGQQAPPAAEAAAEEAVAAQPPPPEPSRIEGKLTKVDAEGMSITVLVPPDSRGSGRAYKKYKMKLDEKTLIMVDQQPATLAGLESGQGVQVMYFRKGKEDVVDTIVVTEKANNE